MKKNSYLVKKRFLAHDAMVGARTEEQPALVIARYVTLALPFPKKLAYLLVGQLKLNNLRM